MLWRELKSLSDLIEQANSIDFTSLDSRLDLLKIPKELRPVVHAINDALTRLDDGAARQRRFIANSAHELRTPVAILRARVDVSEASSSKAEIQRDVRQMQSILEELLSKARAKEFSNRLPSTIDLVEVARSVAMDYLPLAGNNQRRFEFAADDTQISIRGDERAVRSVIGNLISNALRAELEGGAIIVRIDNEGVLAVIDHGEGVPENEREVLFEPFWRTSEAVPEGQMNPRSSRLA